MENLSRVVDADYEAVFGRLLESVVKVPDLTAFWPACGHRYDRGLLVVGRAVNGWTHDWTRDRAADPAGRAAILAQARSASESAVECPLAWVGKQAGPTEPGVYNTNRSAFWRVTRAVVCRLHEWEPPPPDWSSYVCWTNLYKIAPAGGGNPGGKLEEVQRDLSGDLLQREIAAFEPRRVLVLTGRNWFEPFAARLSLNVVWRDEARAVEGVAEDRGTRWVVAKHPERKPEDSAIAEILDAFKERSSR